MHDCQIEAVDASTEGLFETAVYRFIELHAAADCDGLVVIHTDISGPQRRKTVRFSTAEAARSFQRYWDEFRRERGQCAPF